MHRYTMAAIGASGLFLALTIFPIEWDGMPLGWFTSLFCFICLLELRKELVYELKQYHEPEEAEAHARS